MAIERKSWIEWLKSKGLSDKSIKNYLYYFDKFDFDSLDKVYSIRFGNKYKQNSIVRAFLVHYFNYIKQGEFPQELKGLVESIKIPKYTGRKKRKVIHVLQKEDVFAIIKALTNIRDKLMVLITYEGGLRCRELLNIQPYDFDWNEWLKNPSVPGKLKVTGKGKKQRFVVVSAEVMRALYKWIKTEVSQKQDADDKLFKIGERRWEKILELAGTKALSRRIYPHILRHSCATYLMDSGFNLEEIKEYLGHSNISTTTIYLHVNKSSLRKKVAKAFE